MNTDNETWVANLYQKIEAVCNDIDELVTKDPVLYVGNQMQTVGESVKKFYSDVQDILPPLVDPIQHAVQFIPSKCVSLVESSISSLVAVKENTVDTTNEPKELPLVSTEICHKESSTGLCHSEQTTSEISGIPIGESDDLIKKTTQVHPDSSTHFLDVSSLKDKNLSESFMESGHIDEKCDDDHSAKISIESSENHLDNRSEEKGILYDESSQTDATAFEYSGWNIENLTDLDFDIDKNIEGEPLMNLEEKKTLLNGPVNEFECDSNASTTYQSFGSESLIIWNENKEENANQIFAGGLLPENFTDSSDSSSRNFIVESNKINHNPTESVEYFSVSSLGLSSCGSFIARGCDVNNEVSLSCSGNDGSTIDFEDVKMDTIDLSDKKQLGESCVMVEGGELSAFPDMSRSKSYKKMIQDAFMSRRRLTKEYKQLAIWYGDIDKEFSQPTEMNKLPDTGITTILPAQDLADSEWELL